MESHNAVIEKGEPVGECPDCGIVHGDDVAFNFPHPAECSCGSELDDCRIADRTVEVA